MHRITIYKLVLVWEMPSRNNLDLVHLEYLRIFFVLFKLIFPLPRVTLVTWLPCIRGGAARSHMLQTALSIIGHIGSFDNPPQARCAVLMSRFVSSVPQCWSGPAHDTQCWS